MEENKQLTCLFNSGFCHFMCMPSLIFNENLDVAVSKIEKQLSSQDCLQSHPSTEHFTENTKYQ